MKKTLSLLLAIVVAAVAICTLTVCAFANPADGETQATQAPTEGESVTLNDPRDPEPSTQEETQATEATQASQQATEATQATQADDADPTDSSTTSVDDGDATTKQPAKVDDDIPSTGSGIVVPAVALLALAGGVAVAVKSKKD